MENIEFLAQAIECVHAVCLWIYDANGVLLKTTCPDEYHIHSIKYEEHIQKIIDYANQYDKPSIISSGYENMWIIDSRKEDGKVLSIYTIGPFFMDSYPEKLINEQLSDENISLETKYKMLDVFKRLPVISFTKVMEYTVMMHYAITGKKINLHDLHYNQPPNYNDGTDSQTKIHGTYEMEREMLRMVKEGDTSVLEFLSKKATLGTVGKLANDDSDSLRQLKNTVLVAITLFSRAAIEGGLYPETALTLTDHYFQAVEAAKNFQEISNITLTMEKDFVNRVHKIRTNSNYSKPTQTVIDYINLHIEEEIFLQNIASELGYTDYYLSKKFKKETGFTFKEYIRGKKLERAKFLLDNNILSIQDISEKIKFASQSYFTDNFKKKYGMTPSDYRKRINDNN